MKDDLNRQNKELQQAIEAHTPQGSSAAIAITLLTAVPATLKAGADLSALFKTDVSAQGIAYGDGARGLFATAMARRCPDKIAGLGSGYLGDLDGRQYASLVARARAGGAAGRVRAANRGSGPAGGCGQGRGEAQSGGAGVRPRRVVKDRRRLHRLA
jgi:hypothetical protein